jgi:hypothetical protein
MQVTLDPAVASGKGQPLSIDAHRECIGWLGLLLPVILPGAAWLFPTKGVDTTALDSLSSYYYTSGVGALVGILAALALFLLTYQGYPGKHQWADKCAAILGGLAAFAIALFPTSPPAGVPAPLWWSATSSTIHNWASAVMLTMFAVFSLWLFRMTDQKQDVTRDKLWRNRVYLFCGLAIVGSVLWAGYRLRSGNPQIFWPETVAILSFSGSWLVKGRANRSMGRRANAVASGVKGLAIKVGASR